MERGTEGVVSVKSSERGHRAFQTGVSMLPGGAAGGEELRTVSVEQYVTGMALDLCVPTIQPSA